MLFRTSALSAAVLSSVHLSDALSISTPNSPYNKLRVRQEDTANPEESYCGYIIDSVNQGFAYHYAYDAYLCLTSVPFNPAVATRFITYINDTVQFQSTLAYLRDPPAGYQQPAVDILSGLTQIQNNITAQVYKNQYQFEVDVQHLLDSAHDGHLYQRGGIMAAFSFLAPYSITAASPDGASLPKLYITNDLVKSRDEGWTPSAISKINNVDAVEYVTKLASINAVGGIEPNADWNQVFYTPALAIQGSGGIWDSGVRYYPGDEIELVMENGTDYIDYWLALWMEPYRTGPLTTGGDLYNYFVLNFLPDSYDTNGSFYNPAYDPGEQPVNTTEPVVEPAPQESWKTISNGAYPDPDVRQLGLSVRTDGVVSGYFLPQVNAATLSIPSFAQYSDSIGDFSGAVSEFISNTTEQGLKRVVIDLQQNTGGTVELAFSMFKRFFPDVDPYAGSRRRNQHLGGIIGEVYESYFNSLNPSDPDYDDFLADEFVVTPRLNAATGQNFTSWAEYTGPVLEKGDSFSLTERYNLSNSAFTSALFEGWVPLGYAPENPLGYNTPPFAAENIVILTDGACSSTCALLVEMFKQVGVRTIAVGGRPATGPMQAVGGNRGAAVYSGDQIDYDIGIISNPLLNVDNATLATVPQLTENNYRDSGVFTAALGVNLRDQVRPNDTEPLQFKYEPADCRIFYTLANVFNYTRLWSDAVTAIFDDSSKCVSGSTGFSSSNKTAPEPAAAAPPPLSLETVQPDTAVDDENLSESGGPQNIVKAAQSYTIGYCGSGNSCQFPRVQRCEKVYATVCGVTKEHQLCLPQTQDPNMCDPLTAEWEQTFTEASRGTLKRRTIPGLVPPRRITPSTGAPVGGAPPSGLRASITRANEPQQQVKKYGRCRPKRGKNFKTSLCPRG
ncbi:hypothetical protein COCC4DRAFT_199910 [Bipolaris maydis ATCC 48331]|uniref:Uncharacterized protein n=2 Tax=Cochliobolus heterostrophus TaxID=5016 RepID=M2TMP8_COCH5|nr:uncharacterized protein COCC4DRAFT_199910 [Bipolaris maydis ATCC 48331]EMD87799.1 hypothetical protein COCHEDRAFT_1206107 [Bipolaris maydis C5]KAH7552062.1 hypothetical protein BM1_08924 [Bipolaris maydis]ENI03313.1 hypothetical protein COCC4DRAFT_199910 [Bipolaris maydis ATCC 48331]KAJ5024098.1 hypothetical protein J3E73DRAFT_425091 [Bipolaris maydis]KAJ5057488.1 hypothetical protein J3E74DRAFT_476496 [Bipolaris maydis]